MGEAGVVLEFGLGDAGLGEAGVALEFGVGDAGLGEAGVALEFGLGEDGADGEPGGVWETGQMTLPSVRAVASGASSTMEVTAELSFKAGNSTRFQVELVLPAAAGPVMT